EDALARELQACNSLDVHELGGASDDERGGERDAGGKDDFVVGLDETGGGRPDHERLTADGGAHIGGEGEEVFARIDVEERRKAEIVALDTRGEAWGVEAE